MSLYASGDGGNGDGGACARGVVVFFSKVTAIPLLPLLPLTWACEWC